MGAPDDRRPPADERPRVKRRHGRAWAAIGALLLAGAVALVGYAVMTGLWSGPGARREAPAARAPAAPPRTEPPAPRRLKLPPAADELERRRLDARATYAFGAFTDWVAGRQDLTSVQGAQVMLRHYRTLAEMMSWLEDRVSAASADHPIPMTAEGGAQAGGAWGEQGQVVFRDRDGLRRSAWKDLPPRLVLALYEAANRADGPRGPVLLQRRAWARAFAEEYGLTSPTVPRT